MIPALSVQLYSVRDQLASDFPGTLARLAEIGLTRVEPFGLVTFADQLRTGLAANALSAPTAHQALDDGDWDATFDIAASLGIKTVIHPYTPAERWQTPDDVRRLAETLTGAADAAASRGLRVGYHNHAWELSITIDGRTALETLADQLDPAIRLEVDTYWAANAGQDVPQLLTRLGDRVFALHLKDGTLNGNVADQQPLGAGEMDFPPIIAAARALEVPVLEFDAYAGDIFEGIAAGYSYATSTLGATR
jgi:sugar phosphate isomerase/epimerase